MESPLARYTYALWRRAFVPTPRRVRREIVFAGRFTTLTFTGVTLYTFSTAAATSSFVASAGIWNTYTPAPEERSAFSESQGATRTFARRPSSFLDTGCLERVETFLVFGVFLVSDEKSAIRVQV